MRNLEWRRSWGNIVQSKPFLILFGIIILLFSWNIFGFWNKMQETAKNERMVEDKVFALRQQKEDISSEINSLNSDQGKEKFFRENLGLAKEGENVTIIVEDENSPENPEDTSTPWFISFFKNLFK
ncbi:septum formation initiator family protein [Patescibacteria group bacterium]|nr:septum formation initiator family protein [Patescibacteria group bacterium]